MAARNTSTTETDLDHKEHHIKDGASADHDYNTNHSQHHPDHDDPNTPDPNSNTQKGRVIGGKYVKAFQNGNVHHNSLTGPLQTIDEDMPLTMVEKLHHEGQEEILLEFAEGDKENPFNWPSSRKTFISLLLCLMTLFVGLATSAYSVGITRMARDLNTTTELGQLGMFTFNFACAIAPLFLAPFCELVGRRIIYIGAYGLFIIVFIGLALGQNIATILVMRALSGLFSCVGTILVGGTFSDMYPADSRAIPMASFSYVAILGTTFAPVYAGFIDETIGWRWIEGIQGIANIPLFVVCLVFL